MTALAAVWVVATRPNLCAVCHGARRVRLRHLDGPVLGERITRCPHCCSDHALPLLYLTRRTT